MREKSYSISSNYDARIFYTLFKSIPSNNIIQSLENTKNFTKEIWVQNNSTDRVITGDIFLGFSIEAERNKLLNISKIQKTKLYSLTKFGEFICDNIYSQPSLVWDCLHINHLLLYRIEEKVEHAFSAFYNISLNYIYNIEVGKRFSALDINQEILSKISDKKVGFSTRTVTTLLQWVMMITPALVSPQRYIRQNTNHCSIERTYYALSALYKQYNMSLGMPLLFDEKVLEDIKLYLLVPKDEIIAHLKLLQQTYPNFISEQTGHWGISFIMYKQPEVPFPWLE